ncbi:N-acetylmuramoyl-L-alanine amidase [Lentibacillus sp. JNUCC-1]|uniref:N-acetylmuramoyl-L-alanine amidase n=1 Tax=Lentibacillus sp. JNUCC-1 TaxID=2654513 RepID=UPI001320F6E9|nr:N-acetylmuramoyl-L-alanine amidase [Lentibacillus sp. JNUCC-1]MUV39491.1 N-acetylmuramoyl-L-alanine amidase [Lentibacillus sp. JNUCC-1]
MSLLIIDGGHGGMDPGGGSNSHFKEKDKVLEISLYQEKRFKELGVSVAMTRRSDKHLPSGPRTKIVRDSGAKYCISNHINAGGGQGAETIHSIHSNGKLAHRIADALAAVGQNTRRVFTRKWGSNDYYYMHRETGSVETIIVEYGFADNKTDSDRILKHWKTYAEAVVKAFCEHIGHKYVAPGQDIEADHVSNPKPKPNKPSSKWQKVTGNWTGQALRKGQYGKPVGQMQSMLANNNPPFYPEKGAKNNGVDEYFGDKTADAVGRFQSYYGLTVDQIPGPKTYAKLKGSKPAASKPSYVGKRVESKHSGNLRFYSKASWSDSHVAGYLKKGTASRRLFLR